MQLAVSHNIVWCTATVSVFLVTDTLVTVINALRNSVGKFPSDQNMFMRQWRTNKRCAYGARSVYVTDDRKIQRRDALILSVLL